MIDNVIDKNNNAKNFFSLDEKDAQAVLNDNESLKFLSKITKEEVIFKEFVSNINYRGLYQLFESTRSIAVLYSLPSETTNSTSTPC